MLYDVNGKCNRPNSHKCWYGDMDTYVKMWFDQFGDLKKKFDLTDEIRETAKWLMICGELEWNFIDKSLDFISVAKSRPVNSKNKMLLKLNHHAHFTNPIADADLYDIPWENKK
eukprot:UN32780